MKGKSVVVYVDGACDNKYVGCGSNRGAWCCIVVWDGKEKIITGTESPTTSQRMEVAGLVKCLPHLLQNGVEDITIVTDSMYVVYGIRNRRRWMLKRKNGGVIPNDDLWEPLQNLIVKRAPKIEAQWVKGHSGHPYNERCNSIVERLTK